MWYIYIYYRYVTLTIKAINSVILLDCCMFEIVGLLVSLELTR